VTWSVNFIARGKEQARQEAFKACLPNLVNALIVDAIDGIPESGCLIQVKGHGHQAEGANSYSVSSCELVVQPLVVSG
jgi:hypothetical protein